MTYRFLSLIVAGAIASGLGLAAPLAFAAGEQTPVHKKHTKKLSGAPRTAPENDPYFIGDVTGSCKVQKDAGQCVINLGYGRCEPCNVGGNR